MKKLLSSLVVIGFVSAGCGTGAPALPPDESMSVSFSSLSGEGTRAEEDGGADAGSVAGSDAGSGTDAGAVADGGAGADAGASGDAGVASGQRKNWSNAALRVALLDAWVVLGLAPEVAVFRAARAHVPKVQGKQWVWMYAVKEGAIDATATLSAELDGKAVVWKMTLDGTVGPQQFTKFLWYEGRSEVSTGTWQIYNRAGKLVRIDWNVNAPNDRQLTFTNDTGGLDDGAWLQYKQAADTASVSYDFHARKQAAIDWSLSTRAGSMLAADYAGHENQKACWNSNLFDVACP